MLEKYALWKVVNILATSDNEYSVREMARAANIGPGTSKQCLDYLNKNSLLKKRVIGNLYQYSLDQSNPVARQIRNSVIISSVLNEAKKKSIKAYLCSNDDETIIIIVGEGEIKSSEVKKLHLTESHFESVRKNYKDVITIN